MTEVVPTSRLSEAVEEALVNAPFLVVREGQLVVPDDKMVNPQGPTPDVLADDDPIYISNYTPRRYEVTVSNLEDLASLALVGYRRLADNKTIDLHPALQESVMHEGEHAEYASRFIRMNRTLFTALFFRIPEPYAVNGKYAMVLGNALTEGRTTRLDIAGMTAYPRYPSASDHQAVKNMGYESIEDVARRLEEYGRPTPLWVPPGYRYTQIDQADTRLYVESSDIPAAPQESQACIADIAAQVIQALSLLPHEAILAVRHSYRGAYDLFQRAAATETGHDSTLSGVMEQIADAVAHLLAALEAIDQADSELYGYLNQIAPGMQTAQ